MREAESKLMERYRRELSSAVVGDVLDTLGYMRQFLPPTIQPLREDMVVCGRAMTVLEADDDGGEGPNRANALFNQPFGLMLRALDDLRANLKRSRARDWYSKQSKAVFERRPHGTSLESCKRSNHEDGIVKG